MGKQGENNHKIRMGGLQWWATNSWISRSLQLMSSLVKFQFVNWKKPWVKIKWKFPKMRVPPNHSLKNRIFHYKPSSYWGSPMTQETSKSIDLFGWHGTTFGYTNHDSWNTFLKFKTQGSADFFLSVYIQYCIHRSIYVCICLQNVSKYVCIIYIYMRWMYTYIYIYMIYDIYIYDIYIYDIWYIYIYDIYIYDIYIWYIYIWYIYIWYMEVSTLRACHGGFQHAVVAATIAGWCQVDPDGVSGCGRIFPPTQQGMAVVPSVDIYQWCESVAWE